MLSPVEHLLRGHIFSDDFSDLFLQRRPASNLLHHSTQLGTDVLEEVFHVVADVSKHR